jgi:FG-GAP-like repeat
VWRKDQLLKENGVAIRSTIGLAGVFIAVGLVGCLEAPNCETPDPLFGETPLVMPVGDVSRAPDAIVAADFDGDGDVDLMTSNSPRVIDEFSPAVLTIAILWNDGSAGYSEPVSQDVSGAGQLAAADLDSDGDVDLILAAVSVDVVLNSGTGEFGLGKQVYETEDSATLSAVAVSDLTGDGRLDIVAAQWTRDSVVMIPNQGGLQFGVPIVTPVSPNPYRGFPEETPESLVFGDFDGDGDTDVATANSSSATVSILFNDGAGFLDLAAQVVVEAAGSMATGDFDSDGDIDLATAGLLVGSVLLNDGAGRFHVSGNLGIRTRSGSIVAADFNRDGAIDLAVGNWDTKEITILGNCGDATFSPGLSLDAGLDANPFALLSGDLSGCGCAELAVLDWYRGSVSLFLASP